MPATGAELKVDDIRITEPNVHGGAKYMDKLMTRYFADAKFSDTNRALFAFASYNAGPGYVRNIYKYYVSYGLLVKSEEARRAAREAASSGKKT